VGVGECVDCEWVSFVVGPSECECVGTSE
jgi:hypothetical protein